MKFAIGTHLCPKKSARTLDINCQLLCLYCSARPSRSWEPLQPPLTFVVAAACSECEIANGMQRFAPLHVARIGPLGTSCSGLYNPERSRARTIPNERSSRDPVKGVMDRTKIAFAALLPALWLLLCGEGLSAQCVDWSNGTCRDPSCTLQNGKHSSLAVVSSPDVTARRATSRLGKSGNGNTSSVNAVSRAYAVEHAPLAICSARRQSPPDLATRWQFDCRAALDPRAPSSVS